MPNVSPSGGWICSNHTNTMVLKALHVLEIFGTGTAAVIQPINGIVYEGKEYKPVTPFDENMMQVRLTNFLVSVQYGDIDHPWSHVVPKTLWSRSCSKAAV